MGSPVTASASATSRLLPLLPGPDARRPSCRGARAALPREGSQAASENRQASASQAVAPFPPRES